MIRVVDVWHHYGARPILKGVSLEIAPGELVAVMGPNGMGKSTLLGVMAGALSPIQGYVEIDGKRRRRSIDEEIAIRKRVFYLPDDAYLPKQVTGRQFVLTVGRIYGVDEARLQQHVDQLLALFDLQEKGDQNIGNYSTGQRKKISLCAALVSEAPILILDEPFSGGLDSSGLHAMSAVLKGLADSQDTTVVMAVPVPELVETLAHRVALVADGEIRACDAPDGLRRLSGVDGSFGEAIDRLLKPELNESIQNYMAGRAK